MRNDGPIDDGSHTYTYDAGTAGQSADAGTAGGLHFQLTDPSGTRRVQANSAGEAELDCQSLPFGDQLSCFPDPNAPDNDQDEDATGILTGIHFTGKERDTESGLDYFGARYYGSNMGRFMSPDNGIDQDTSDPQSLNLYSYVRNNPLNRIDPNGRLTIIVPGTNWSSANWNDNMKLVNEAREAFHDSDVRILDWSGSLTNGARLDGASMLSDMVSGHTFAPGEQLNVIGHSRGGEVALDATTELSHKIDNLITLDAPAGDDVVPNMANIGNWINVSVAQDWVQYLNSAFGTSPRQQSGAHNLTLNAPQYGHIASHSAVWQDDSLRSQWWRFWGQNGGCQDSWNPKTNTLTGCP